MEIDIISHSETENWFTFSDFYKRAAEEPGFTKFVEVGVWKGHSVSFLANELKKRGEPFSLYAVDLWETLPESHELSLKYFGQVPKLYEMYNYNLEKAGVRDLVIDIKSDSAEAASRFEDKSLDFVFIDADHSYESVKKDLKSWLPKVRRGGMLCGHDFCCEGVKTAVNEVLVGKPIFFHNSQDVWVYVKETN